MSRISRRRHHKKNPEAHAAATAQLSGASAPAPAIELFEFIPRLSAPQQRRKPGTERLPKALRNVAALRSSMDEGYVQREDVPQSVVPGASALVTFLAGPGSAPRPLELDDDLNELLAPPFFDPEEEGVELGRVQSSRHHAKRAAQHATWRDTIMPLLVPALLRHIHGKGGYSPPVDCQCSGRHRRTITLADWEGTRQQSFVTCRCARLAPQLVELGYFPCAPKRPSMAFSMKLLEFMSLHSLHVAPNNTAWAATLEAFWARRASGAEDARAFRKRLGNAVQWYQVLMNRKDAVIRSGLDGVRQSMRRKRRRNGADDNDDTPASKRARLEEHLEGHTPQERNPSRPALTDANHDDGESVPGPAQDAEHAPRRSSRVRPNAAARAGLEPREPRANAETEQQSHTAAEGQQAPTDAAIAGESASGATESTASEQQRPTNDQPAPRGNSTMHERPTEYLRARCPLCFGGQRPVFQHTTAHAIVCLDANFAQKRRKSKYIDPVLIFSGGKFVPAEEVEAMEREVDGKRKRPARRRTKGTSASLADDVLDECESSFLAAQEKVTKASKNYYADTGLMALLCRHDRVVFLANLTSPGERQHYALVLLRKLFEGLPADWNIGVLYDIACQLSRSIEKHDLLEQYADRLVFGVSVFHAYGHQWACQLVFHPRKREGFGLTDGEGCERFWSSIRHLIACLRVSGFWRRQFVLDRQIEFLDEQSLFKMGRWLSKKWADAAQRLRDAQLQLALCGVSEEVLRAQWREQIRAQTARAPRQSKNAGDKQLDKILLDLAHIDDLKQEMADERARLRAGAHRLAAKEVQDLTASIDQAKRDIKAARSRVAIAQSQLGTGSIRRFEELRGDAYVRARVNARALRVSIRMAVQAHKFEREKLERDYRRQIMQNKDHVQTRDLVHTRERNITTLVKKYNAQVNHMAVLLRDNIGPRRKLALPRTLDAKKLFRLDVDDDIWQEDAGLGPQDEGELPRWQIDEAVRKGIRVMLDVTRCREERERLLAEAKALLAWWTEECNVLRTFSLRANGDALLQAEGTIRLRKLGDLARTWNKALAGTDFGVTFVLPSDEGTSSSFAPLFAVPSDALDAASLPAVQQRPDARDLHVSAIAEESDTLAEDSDSEGSFYLSGDDITEAGEDEQDALLLDMATAALSDDDAEDEAQTQAISPAVVSSPLPVDPAEEERERRSTEHTAQTRPRSADSAISIEDSDTQSNPISISSDSDSDDGAAGPALPARRRAEQGRMCGRYNCSNEDLERMASRTAWLSGTGLAVYAESQLRAVAAPTIGHCPSTLLVDVRDYMEVEESGDNDRMCKIRSYVWGTVKNLPHPSDASKWLIIVHIPTPRHWVLVAVCWREQELRFYDSMSASGTYDVDVKTLTLKLLELCEDLYSLDLSIPSWTWVGEQRRARQQNFYDCGPFVAADFVSLLTSDEPSKLAQRDMKDWRERMVVHMRTLPLHRSKAMPLTEEQLRNVEIIDV